MEKCLVVTQKIRVRFPTSPQLGIKMNQEDYESAVKADTEYVYKRWTEAQKTLERAKEAEDYWKRQYVAMSDVAGRVTVRRHTAFNKS